MIRTVEWRNGAVVLLDQRLLPWRETYRVYRSYRRLAEAIRDMVVRGAPAIGVTAAYGVAMGMQNVRRQPDAAFEAICSTLAASRPTAVNLFWALERMRSAYAEVRNAPLNDIKDRLLAEAHAIYREDIETNRALGMQGARLLPNRARILTHCNAGALATAGYGTALGVVRAAVEAGKTVHVFATETRPFLQGARLTCWELLHDGIPTTLLTDNMAGDLMSRGEVDCVIVGADRIAANGDVANKIGTYALAVLAKAHGIPFYVAAPFSTVDLECATGSAIPIEQRAAEEVTHIAGKRIAPKDVGVINPAFDVTPHRYVTALITERGVLRRPFRHALQQAANQSTAHVDVRRAAANPASKRH
ncbi:MAG: S-methyl-5-thioribose-1-phosphate isomerase [Candidatus Binatia bacterium]|nr:S-methyl-5-thioribose-1-phosphate isomerase [Candidatus Binatia bacterium]